MPDALSFNLHLLTGRLDRAADRLLQTKEGLSYSRFMVLLMVGELHVSTQRSLSERLGVSEPATSRMVAVLAADGLLDVVREPDGGNRRRLSLTSNGKKITKRCSRMLERQFVELVKRSGVSFDDYALSTARLIAALDGVDDNSKGSKS